jgi:hypothetical protein
MSVRHHSWDEWELFVGAIQWALVLRKRIGYENAEKLAENDGQSGATSLSEIIQTQIGTINPVVGQEITEKILSSRHETHYHIPAANPMFRLEALLPYRCQAGVPQRDIVCVIVGLCVVSTLLSSS